jgi:hypothetical protein
MKEDKYIEPRCECARYKDMVDVMDWEDELYYQAFEYCPWCGKKLEQENKK